MADTELVGKGKIKAVIIYSKSEAGRILQAAVIGKTPYLVSAGNYNSFDEYNTSRANNNGTDPLFLVEERISLETIKKIKSRHPRALIVLARPETGIDYPDHESAKARINMLRGLLDCSNIIGTIIGEGFLSPEIEINKLERILERAAEERKIPRQISIGFWGMGEFGRGGVREIMSEPWIGEIICGSNYFSRRDQRNETPFQTLFKIPRGGERIELANSLYEVIERNPDVLVITTGPHRFNYNKAREKITPKLFRKTLPKTPPIFEAIQKYPFNNFVIDLSHPPGPFLAIGKTFYGIKARQLTSFSSEDYRGQRIIFDMLIAKDPGLKNTLRREEIHLDIWGEHGEGVVPHWETATIRQQPLESYLESHGIEKEDVVRELIEMGRRVMTTSKKENIDYIDVPKSVKEGLAAIANQQVRPPFPWYRSLTEKELQEILPAEHAEVIKSSFLMLPSKLEYGSEIGIRANGNFHLKDEREETKRRLAELVIKQQEYVQKAERYISKRHHS